MSKPGAFIAVVVIAVLIVAISVIIFKACHDRREVVSHASGKVIVGYAPLSEWLTLAAAGAAANSYDGPSGPLVRLSVPPNSSHIMINRVVDFSTVNSHSHVRIVTHVRSKLSTGFARISVEGRLPMQLRRSERESTGFALSSREIRGSTDWTALTIDAPSNPLVDTMLISIQVYGTGEAEFEPLEIEQSDK